MYSLAVACLLVQHKVEHNVHITVVMLYLTFTLGAKHAILQSFYQTIQLSSIAQMA